MEEMRFRLVTPSSTLLGISPVSFLPLDDPDESLLPHLQDLRHVSVKVAAAVANAAIEEGVATVSRDSPFTEEELRNLQWDPGAFSCPPSLSSNAPH
jgi:malic enzyme